MAYDTRLKLSDAGTPITGTGGLAPIACEGGFRCDVDMFLGVITDSDEVFNLDLEVSIDGGSNYFPILRIEPLTNDEEGTATIANKISRPVFVPPPTTPGNDVYVRWNCISVAGTTPSLPLDSWLVPLMSLAPSDLDRATSKGLYNLYT